MVLNEILTNSFEVEEKASSLYGWCAGCLMGSWRIAINSFEDVCALF